MATAEASPPVTLRDHRWRWRDLVIGLAPILLVDVVLATDGGGIRHSLPAWFWIASNVLQAAWMLAWPLWAARCLPSPPRFRRLLIEAGWALLAVPAVLAVQSVLQALLPPLLGPQGVNNPLEPAFRAASSYHRTALTVLAIGVAPFAEEAFFRGLIYNALRQRIPCLLAALVSGAAFGMMHYPFGLLERIGIAVVGFLLALLYEWRQTLVAPILLHAMTNALGVALLSYAVATTPILGVQGDPAEQGCVLVEVIPGSSAADAGLRPGDVITHAGENSVGNPRDLSWIVRTKKIGDKLPVWYKRGGEEGYVEVVLKGRPTP